MKTRRKQQGGHHLYKRLGVSKYASQKLIRKAFKTLKKKRKANKKVKEAYKILSNKKSRKQYNNRYRKAVKRGGKRKTRKRKGGNPCYGISDHEDSKLCEQIHQAAQYYDTSRPERLSRGQKIARKFKNITYRRKQPKPESQQQVAQQKRATFLKFKNDLEPKLNILQKTEDKKRNDLIQNITGKHPITGKTSEDPMGKNQDELETQYYKAIDNTDKKLDLMEMVNKNLSNENDKSTLPAKIKESRNFYHRVKNPFSASNENENLNNFNVNVALAY